MISETKFYGDAIHKEISSDLTMVFGNKRVWSVSATVSGLSVILPAINLIPIGGTVFYLLNVGNRRLTIKDNDGNDLEQIEGLECVKMNRYQ